MDVFQQNYLLNSALTDCVTQFGNTSVHSSIRSKNQKMQGMLASGLRWLARCRNGNNLVDDSGTVGVEGATKEESSIFKNVISS